MRAWRLAAALLLAAGPCPAPAPAPSPEVPRPCTANGLCLCHADHLACDAVPFYRFPDTESSVRHVSVSRAHLGALAGAALDGRRLRTLVLVASKLHQLDPAALSSMTSTLASLDLSYNEFSHVPIEAIRDLKVLNWLNLQNNFIVDLDPKMDWGFLGDSLSSLSLSNNQLTFLQEGALTSLRQLAQLELDGNRLRELDAHALPSSLALLRLSDNLLSRVPCAALAPLTRLRHLHLRNNALAVSFAGNRSCRAERYRIDSLDLSYNDLTDSFEFDFAQGLQLKQLALDLNDFTAIPPFVLDCGRIEKLSISYNDLTHLSDTAILTLKRDLERLDVDNNEITFLPQSMQELTRLRHLSVAYNRLRDVEWLPPRVRSLSLAGNYLEGLPAALLTIDPGTLRYLDVGYNRITLNSNELRALPRDCFKNTLLEYLDLSDNKLTLFPSSALTQVGFTLRRLELARNQLEYLDSAMFHAIAFMHELNLAHHLRHLEAVEPRAFRPLVSLRSLSLESPMGSGHGDASLADISSALPGLESLTIVVRKVALDSQLIGLHAPKLRVLELRGTALKRVSPYAFEALSGQRALTLRLSGTSVSVLPAGLARPLARVPHLGLDLSDNQLVNFGPSTLYPNLTGWNRLATKLLPGGLVLVGNPLRCGCSASWVGAWLRRWTAEVGGGARGAREAARRSHCQRPGAAPRALLALDADEAECHASALSSSAALSTAPQRFSPLLLLIVPIQLASSAVFS
ncbi:unnamed protein product, partial [Iphiclides podalirius]